MADEVDNRARGWSIFGRGKAPPEPVTPAEPTPSPAIADGEQATLMDDDAEVLALKLDLQHPTLQDGDADAPFPTLMDGDVTPLPHLDPTPIGDSSFEDGTAPTHQPIGPPVASPTEPPREAPSAIVSEAFDLAEDDEPLTSLDAAVLAGMAPTAASDGSPPPPAESSPAPQQASAAAQAFGDLEDRPAPPPPPDMFADDLQERIPLWTALAVSLAKLMPFFIGIVIVVALAAVLWPFLTNQGPPEGTSGAAEFTTMKNGKRQVQERSKSGFQMLRERRRQPDPPAKAPTKPE